MKTQDVKLYAVQQLHRLQALPDNQRRAELAKLRRNWWGILLASR